MVIVQAILGLAFVIFLLYFIMKLVQKYGAAGKYSISNADRIRVTSVAYIDDSTKVVCVAHGPSKYVFVVGKNSSLLLDKYENYEKEA